MSGDGHNEPRAGRTGEESDGLGGERGGRVPSQRGEASSGPSADASPSPPAPSDADLVMRMREGDDSAYEELFRRHSDAVRRYARTCCRDAHTADDLTAEVFTRTLQAVRGGAGPEQAVRAYLLTAVRRVAAVWARSARREHLVEDFAVFADQAARATEAPGQDTLLGADVRAMHAAERSMALRAFRSLPERWQAVLWHTTVEEEPPSAVAPLFGLTANATAVLAGRAREGLKQAYLQAHVSSALTSGGDCARYADRLGAYARGALRMRAERGLRKHLEACAGCRLAAGELDQVNSGIPALLPVAFIGWFAAGYSFKAAGVVAAGAAGAGAGATAGAAGAGSASGSPGGAGGAGGAAAAEGLAAPVKAGIAAAVAAAVGAGLVWALAGGPEPRPHARPPAAQPVPAGPSAPGATPLPDPPDSAAPGAPPASAPRAPEPAPPSPAASPTPSRAPAPGPDAPGAAPAPVPPGPPGPPGPPAETAAPPPAPPPPTTVHRLDQLRYAVAGDHTKPEVRLGAHSWIWKRDGMSIGGTRYEHGVSVHAHSSVTIDLNRECLSYDALVGVDDMTLGLGAVRFSVYADGVRRWRSPVLRGGDEAVGVSVGLTGRKTLRLVVAPHDARPLAATAVADWARSRITCV